MDDLLFEIIECLRDTDRLSDRQLEQIVNRHNQGLDNSQQYAKKQLLPYYLRLKREAPEILSTLKIDSELETRLFETLRVKPRRTASGVATITVITKPWVCSSDCLFCPNDLRMPKSYLSSEPACQRAERSLFDPYLQVAARLRTLFEMGHDTEKIELIVLGGSFTDYPESYQTWFISEVFQALNDGLLGDVGARSQAARQACYAQFGLVYDDAAISARVQELQQQVNLGELSYNQAVRRLYAEDETWQRVAEMQQGDAQVLDQAQLVNETAKHRMVGLSVEIRPDAVSVQSLLRLRQLGCTKIQMGIQSLDQQILDLNERNITVEQIAQSFQLLRLFGFKIQTHFMLNLLGATAQADMQDYLRLVRDERFLPDEVKLYPCALVESARLMRHHLDGSWQPYSEAQLIDVLAFDVMNTPAYVRISRMIRDISAPDIVVGNKKTNLRQMVEQKLDASGREIQEIRYREIALDTVGVDELALQTTAYDASCAQELFIEWVSGEDRIAGFLRLSLPKAEALAELAESFPIAAGQAMIREVHVYGQVARLSSVSAGAQHLGLGRQLIDYACEIARDSGYESINVISSIGTREYYRRLGFTDGELYQSKLL